MKYMLIMNTPRDGYTQYMNWPAKILEANTAFMETFTRKLAAAGELVGGEGLASPEQAKLVRAGADGKPITDGVFPESKEFLAGYWIIDVDSPERAMASQRRLHRAGRPVTAADGTTIEHLWIEVRQILRQPQGPWVTSPPPDLRAESLLRDLAPQVLGAMVRRFRDFAASEDAVQEAMIAAAEQWPRDGIPDNPRGWLFQVARGG